MPRFNVLGVDAFLLHLSRALGNLRDTKLRPCLGNKDLQFPILSATTTGRPKKSVGNEPDRGSCDLWRRGVARAVRGQWRSKSGDHVNLLHLNLSTHISTGRMLTVILQLW